MRVFLWAMMIVFMMESLYRLGRFAEGKPWPRPNDLRADAEAFNVAANAAIAIWAAVLLFR